MPKVESMKDVEVDAEEAARILGVTRQTLYSYVSRGSVVRLPREPGRPSAFARAAIEALAQDRRRGRRPADVARAALDWGVPVLETEITLIESGRLYYRGRDAIELSDASTFEDVAALLWKQADVVQPLTHNPDLPGNLPSGSRPSDILARFTRSATAEFAPIWLLDPARAAVGSGSLLRVMAGAVLGTHLEEASIAQSIARHWSLNAEGADVIRRALILSADHELNASTFTVRCIASTGADLPAALAGGLAALSGPRHGGMTVTVSDYLDAIPSADAAERQVRRTLTNVGAIPGFGHQLYPAGDPRAAALIGALGTVDPVAAAVREHAHAIAGQHPTLDFALVALARSLSLPASAAFAIFAMGRTAGWIAHALEQRTSTQLIRPRSRYVGDRPAMTN